MDDNIKLRFDDCLILLVAVTASLFAGAAFGVHATNYMERKKAIEANVGRYVVEPTSGAVRFEYGKEGE